VRVVHGRRHVARGHRSRPWAPAQGAGGCAGIELDPVPEERIDYHIRAETPMEGTLTLLKLDEHHTTLQLHAEFDPQKVSDTHHLSQQDLDRRLQERLEAMKSIVEGKE
jgi:hypothetical protein